MKLNKAFKICGCSYSDNSDELKKVIRGRGREFVGPYNWESQVVALVSGMAGSRVLDSTET